jgi:hypothetical protein
MTVSTGTNFKSYAGNGSTTTFAYTFKIFQDTNLVVTLVNDTTGAETTQSLTTNYTVTGVGSDSGGNVVFVTAPPSGNTAVIRRVLPITQETNYVPNDPFPAEAHEDALDKLTMLVQQEATSNDLAISFPEGDVGSGLENTLPSAADRAGQIISFDTSGNVSTTNIANVPSIGTVNLSVSGVASFADGSASAPSITNIGDTNTGMYFGAADQINFSVSGSEVISVASTGTTISGLTISSGDILLTDNSATALEIKEGSNNYLTFDTTNGSEKLSFGSTANPTFEVNGSFNQPLIAATTSFFSQTYSGATLSATNGAVNIESYSASKAGIVLNGSGDQITFTSPTLGFVGLVQVVGAITTNTSLNIASSTTVTGILDEDDMSSNSDTKLATQQSIKAYVDAQVGTVDTLAEVLGNGNTTGGTNIVVSANDVISLDDGTNALPSLTTTGDLNTGIYFPAADEVGITTGGTQRVKVDSTGVNVTGTVTVGTLIDTPDIETSTVSARDGTTSFSIADSTGTATFNNSLTISRNSGTGFLPTLDIICTDTTAIQNQTLGALDFQTSDTNEAGTLASIQARKTNSTSASTNLAALELYTGRPGDLIKAVTINADQTTSFAAAIDVTGTVTATGTSVFASLDISGDIDVDGTTNLDATNIVGALDVTGTITSDGLTVDTNTLHVDATNNRVGIGTDSPSAQFTSYKSLNGDPQLGHFYNDNSGAAAEAVIYITNSSTVADGLFLQTYGANGTTAGGFVQDASIIGSGTGASGGLSIMTRANADMRFYTNGHTNERMTIDSSGNVNLTGLSNGTLNFAGGNTSGGSKIQAWNDAGNANGYLAIEGYSSEYMRIDSSGNVGIGTTSPSKKLHISGDRDAILRFENTRTVESGDQILGSLEFYSNDESGTGANVRSRINAFTAGGGNASYLTFSTADGTTDDVEAMRIDSSGNLIIASTGGTLQTATAGTSNFRAGVNAGNSIVSGGNYNTVVGDEAGTAITTGDNNVAVGFEALKTSTTASSNTAVGYQAGYSNTTGTDLTAIGYQSLDANTTGNYSTAVGYASLGTNTTGSANEAFGREALRLNTTGSNNTALGYRSLDANTTGGNNIAVGQFALGSNTTASNNTAVGYQAGYSATTSGLNTFVGDTAGYNSNATNGRNTFIGTAAGYAMTTGEKNTILGRYNGNFGGLDIRTSDNNIVLSDGDGNPRLYSDGNGSWYAIRSNTNGAGLEINNTGVYGSVNIQSKVNRTSSGGNYYFYAAYDSAAGAYKFQVHDDGDVVNTNNSYGAISDVKLKENIVDSNSQWDDIKALTVRKYSMKSDNLDAPNMLGVIAQEVEAAGMTGLVRETIDRDGEGNLLETSTKQVNYSILYMKAVKALQEAMDRIETLEAKVTALENA